MRSVVLATNIWSPHMVPLATELFHRFGNRFRMVLFESTHEERLATGWSDLKARPSWLSGPPEDLAAFDALARLCVDAQVAIIGSVPLAVMRMRAAAGKLTLVMRERPLKHRGHALRLINPRYAAGFRGFRRTVNRREWHCLAIGHYTPTDLLRIRAFEARIWRWGYFVELNPVPPADRRGPLDVLWVGRMVRWKRVDTLIRAVAEIKGERWFSACTIVGTGPERPRLTRLASELGLTDRVRFLPPVPLANVRQLMREHDVTVLTSDRNEGWGAVSGEAMSEGSLLIANAAAGSSRELVRHGETGLLYSDVTDLVLALRRAGSSDSDRNSMRAAAWKNMQEQWAPSIAAERLIALCEDLLESGDSTRYSSGPGSRWLPSGFRTPARWNTVPPTPAPLSK